MLVMVAVGVMNLPWMLLLTALIFLEKTWRYGERLSFFIGFGLLIFATFVLAEPALLAGLSRPLSFLC
jgi:predicted metal-binding membrane protein